MQRMTVLVEDDVNVFPYNLLCGYGEHIIGSTGNKNVYKFLEENKLRNAIVYMDVLPDNASTAVYYNKAVEVASILDNVFVVPIPCIEYYFISAFIGYSSGASETALSFGNYKKHLYIDRGKRLAATNFEKYCKSVVRNSKQCFYNTRFTKDNCPCDKYEKTCVQMSLDMKRTMLQCRLPIWNCTMENFMRTGNSDVIRSIIANCIDLYYVAGNRFMKYNIIDSFVEI